MNTKKVIMILAILVIIIIVIGITILLLRGNSNKNIEKYIATPEMKDEPIEIKETLERVTIRNNYYVVKNCITKFYTYYNSIYNIEDSILIKDEETIASIEDEKKRNIEAVYNILDENYKKYKNITLDNLTTKLSEIDTVNIEITDMYVSQKDENISIYFVYGYLIDTSSKTSNFSMIVNVDMLNRTYAVLLEDYIKENYENVKVGEKIEIPYSKQIVANTYNTFKYQAITDETYITDTFNSFIENLIYNKSEIYDSLDENYKQKRFENFESFEEYLNENIKEIAGMKLSKYQKTKYEDYIQYVCLANNGKYYIINEFSPTDKQFILDTYTVDLPEFLEKYDSADEKTKVALNIEKIKEAINEGDYQYVYNKLDSIFTQNNYPNYNNFKEFLELNLFDKNTFEYKNIEKQGDVYVANIIINETKRMDIIMQLSDNTDFCVSFSIEE